MCLYTNRLHILTCNYYLLQITDDNCTWLGIDVMLDDTTYVSFTTCLSSFSETLSLKHILLFFPLVTLLLNSSGVHIFVELLT